MKALEVVENYLGAMESGADITGYLAEDFSFNGPMLQANSRAEFLQGMAGMASMKPRFEMLKKFEDGNETCCFYNFHYGDKSVFMSEWSVVRDGKIASQRLVFDTKAFGAMMGG